MFGEANVDNGTMAEDGMFAVVANHVHGIHISVRSKDRLELVPVEASGAGDEKGGWRPGGTADDGGNARLEGPGCISGGGDNLERCTIADGIACQKIGVLAQRIDNHRLHDASGTLDGCRIPVAPALPWVDAILPSGRTLRLQRRSDPNAVGAILHGVWAPAKLDLQRALCTELLQHSEHGYSPCGALRVEQRDCVRR